MKNFFLFIVLCLSVSCTEEKVQPQVENTSIQGEVPAHESWKSKIMFTDDGKKKAVLFSDHLMKYDIQKITLFDRIKIHFYNKEQKNTSQLTALRGKRDDVSGNMYAYDDVVASNDSGVVLKTGELMWRNSDQKIITDKFVTITSPKETIEGFGFESDQHLDNYVIYKVTYSSTVPGSKK